MSKIIFAPEIVEGRYVHFSYSGESCAIRDFMATGDRPIRDYRTSEVKPLVKDWLQADRIPISDIAFWVKRLTDVTKYKLGNNAEFVENSFGTILKEEKKIPVTTGQSAANNFSSKKPEVLFYGERGIVNTLFIELSRNKEAFKDFMGMVINGRGESIYKKQIEDISFVIEPDFGKVGFGTTDAVIVVNNELLIFFEAKRNNFGSCRDELTYQIELNYSLAKHLSEISNIPAKIELAPYYSSDICRQRGTRGGDYRRLNINDEHAFFFKDFIRCSKFSCLSLTTDLSEKPIARYYSDIEGYDLENLSWIGYEQLNKLISDHKLGWLKAHIELNRRHFGFYI
jgi:hypothetical protein